MNLNTQKLNHKTFTETRRTSHSVSVK